MTLSGAAQSAAAHCPNEQTVHPAVCSHNRLTYAPASQPHYGLHPAMFSGNDSLRVWGSAVSLGDWGGTPAEIEFGAF